MHDEYVIVAISIGATLPWLLRRVFKHILVYVSLLVFTVYISFEFAAYTYREDLFQKMIDDGLLNASNVDIVYLSWLLRGAMISLGIIVGMYISGLFFSDSKSD